MVSAEFCFLEQKTSVQNPEIEASVYAFWFLCFFINFCKKQKTERAKNIFSTVNSNTGADEAGHELWIHAWHYEIMSMPLAMWWFGEDLYGPFSGLGLS